jgi:hypothetical protein
MGELCGGIEMGHTLTAANGQITEINGYMRGPGY